MAKKRPFLRRGPSGPLADVDTIVQVGYDQAVDDMLVPPAGGGAFFPRNAKGDPLKVVLPDVTPGNFLEVDWRLNLEAALDASYLTTFTFAAVAVVTFDGSVPTIGNAGTFLIIDSWGASLFVDPDAQTADVESMSALAAVPIPDGATTATVELLYLTTGDTLIANTLGLSATLKASELGEGLLSQAGPGSLLQS